MALRDASLRESLLDQFRRSRFREGKVEFRAFLWNPAATGLIRASANAAGKGEAEWRSTLAALPALELYLPIAEQRQSWDGDGNILVLGTAMNSSRVRRSGRRSLPAFDTAGRLIMLSLDAKPRQTLISLVPVETDFRIRPSFAQCDPEDDCGGGGGGGGGLPVIHDGWYADKLWMYYPPGEYDGYPFGSPEFEVWLARRVTADSFVVPLDANGLRPCASEEYLASGAEYFNYDNPPTAFTDDVLFSHGSRQELDSLYGDAGSSGWLFVTENDDTPCPSSDRPSLPLFHNTDILNDDEMIHYAGLPRFVDYYFFNDVTPYSDPHELRIFFTPGRTF